MAKTTIPTGGLADNAVTIAKATGFGKVAQVVQNVITSGNTASSSTSFAATSHLVAITPSATSSNILLSFSFQQGTQTNNRYPLFRIYRDIGGAGYSAVYPATDIINVGGTYDNNDIEMSVYHRVPLLFLDSPNTTSAVNYKVYVKNSGGSNVTISNSNGDSTINLFEVSA